MKKNRFSEERIIRILKEAEQGGKEIRELSRHHGITEQAFYRWRQKYGGLSVSEAHRLRELEKENSRLKRIVADRDLELDAMKELLTKKGRRSAAPPGSRVPDATNDLSASGLRAARLQPVELP